MIVDWFESKFTRNKDKAEIASIRNTYGDDAKKIVGDRLNSVSLSQRDREHWKRIARKL
jgi:hypothetical protein